MIGKKLSNRFEVLRELGRGGMGVVYLAKDPVLEREIAIKLVTPAALNPATEERFRREARIVAGMDHPAIVGLYDIGEHEGSLFIVMPFVPGSNLRSFIKDRSLRIKDVVELGIQVAEALEYSHSRGVVHRDIKPENIMVLREESPAGDLRVRITDFGLAVPTSESRLTQSGALVGTVGYMSPEQVLHNELDRRSDVYSLGTVLYECVVGETPFAGELLEALYRITHENPQSPRSLGAEIPEELEGIILRCLEKAPSRRPQRAGELAADLIGLRSRLQVEDAYRAVTESTRRPAILHRPALSPFIGREQEFAELQRRLNAAASGECQFAVVGGESGIGKSRLLEELAKLALVRKFQVLHGRFAEHHHAFPYQGFCDVIQEYLRARAEAGHSAEFSDLAGDLVALFPVLTEFEGMKPQPREAPKSGSSGGFRKFDDRTYLFELLARSLSRIAGGKPCVVFLEDLHAADVSVEALQYIVHRLMSVPVLIVATFRATDVDKSHPVVRMLDSFEGDRRFVLILLQPFTSLEHRAFVEAISGASRVEDDLAEKLFHATDGNPYFTRELFRSLMDSKTITKNQSNLLKLSGNELFPSQTLPATIQQAVTKRLERLPKDLRQILSVASVLGKTFAFDDLQVLAEKEDLEDAVDKLVEDGFIEEERESRGDRLRFSSGMLRDVLYADLPPRKRRSLHRKYAEELERRNADRLDRVFPQLVHHYSNADVAEKVIDYGLQLARASLEAFSPEDAARSAKTVLDFLEDEESADPLLHAEVRILLAEAHRMSGKIDSALVELEEAVQILERKQETAQAVNAMLLAVEIAWEGRRFDRARIWAEKGIPIARLIGERNCLSRLLSIAATIANLGGEFEKAKAYTEELEFTQTPAGEETLSRGGRLVVALSATINAVDPSSLRVDEEYEVFANVFETLLRTDAQGNLVPSLCERWEPLDLGRSFLFTIRHYVRLHDGRLLNAHHVKDSFEKAITRSRHSVPAALAAIKGVKEFLSGSAESVSGMIVFSEDKFGIELSERLPLYPAMLSDMSTAVFQQTAEGKIIGTGAFQIASLAPHQVVLERNPAYRRKDQPFLDSIEFRASLSSKEIAIGLRSGAFDLARDLLPQELDDILQDSRLKTNLIETPEKNVYFVLFNTAGPVARNSALTRSLCEMVRTHDLVRKTLGRFAQPAEGLLPPGILGHDPGRRRRTTHDQQIDLGASTDLSHPIRLRAAVHPIYQDRYASLTETLFKIWAEAGVEVSIETATMTAFLDCQEKNEDIDLMMGRWIPDYDDPDNFTYGLFHSRMGSLRNYFSSKTLDGLLEAARVETRSGARGKLYRQIEDLLMNAGCLLPLFHDIDYRVAGPNVRRLSLHSSPPYVNYAEIGKVEEGVPAVARKKAGGVMIVPVARELHHLDPSLAFIAVSAEVVPNIFETLTRHHGGARTAPWLATEVIPENGGKRFRFRLREDVRFHDSRKLTARDVRYSFERLLTNPESKSRWFLFPIRGGKALSEGRAETLEGFQIHSSSEFTIELEQPLSFFPTLLTFPGTAIVAEGSERLSGNWKQGCVGTGPFRVVRFEPGRLLELEANPYYWRRGLPKSEGLVFTFGISPSEIISGFKAGRYSLASDLIPADVESLRRESEFAYQYRDSPRLSTEYVAFNYYRGPLQDKNLRLQLIQSVDVGEIVRRNLGRVGIPACGLIPPGMLGYEPSQTAPVHRAGRSFNVELVAAISPRHQGRYSALAHDILHAFEETGVRIRIVNPKESEYPEILATASVDLIITGWTADYPDADTFVHGAIHSQLGADGRFCGTPQIDQLSEQGRIETEPAVRHRIYRQVEDVLKEEALLLPLFHEQNYRFARPDVEGLEINLFSPTVNYESLWIRW